MKPLFSALGAALVLSWAVPVASQPPVGVFPAPQRPVAAIVSPEWWNDAQRDAADEDGQLARGLKITPGMAVADIGAGAGFHSLRLSRVVGPGGHIYAQDVMADYLSGLRATVEQRGIGNIELVLGAPDDPRLPPGSVDRAIMVHMYHEVAEPYALLYNLVPALRPGAKVGVIDLDRPTYQHGSPIPMLRCEFSAVGYREESITMLRGGVGYLAVFTAPRPDQRPPPQGIRPCREEGTGVPQQ